MLRTIVIGMAVALAGCASTKTKSFAPGDYTAGKGSGFFSTVPKAGTNKADFTLRQPMHVILIKPVGTYSLVRLPDRSVGYISNDNLTAGVAAAAKPSPTPKKKSAPKPSPESENSETKPKPTPAPEVESRPKPTPAPAPEQPATPPPDEVPAFRY